MDPEQRHQLIDALEGVIAEAGVLDMYSGAQRLKRWLERHLEFIAVSQSREQLDAFFATCEGDDSDLQQYLALFVAFPTIAKAFVASSLMEAAKRIPIPSGRPSRLTPDTKRKIIAKVGSLYTNQRVRIGVAQSRAALEFGVSKRTVESVWNQREQIAAQQFQSMQDVWNFLSP